MEEVRGAAGARAGRRLAGLADSRRRTRRGDPRSKERRGGRPAMRSAAAGLGEVTLGEKTRPGAAKRWGRLT